MLKLYLVLDPAVARHEPMNVASAALDEGVTCLQLRWKGVTDRVLLDLARPLAGACHDRGVPFIVNDRLDLALAAGADGVHLGVDDLPVADARRLAGPDFIIGYSPDLLRDLREARAQGADYLGIGPFFGTTTKTDAGSALGAEGFRARRRATDLPVVAIGGITARNAMEPIRAGASGVAVTSAIAAAVDPSAATRELRLSITREM